MKEDMNTTINELKKEVKVFIKKRDWEKYHNLKDLAESICIEAAELLEIFQWRNSEEIEKLMENEKFKIRISEEIADIIIYLLSMSENAKIDITKAVLNKIKKNEEKYPIEKYFGKAHVDEEE
ncbi:MAG: nucleotide pyrophosphohydrolase [Candidatus Aenigmatarchaeota archaeon]